MLYSSLFLAVLWDKCLHGNLSFDRTIRSLCQRFHLALARHDQYRCDEVHSLRDMFCDERHICHTANQENGIYSTFQNRSHCTNLLRSLVTHGIHHFFRIRIPSFNAFHDRPDISCSQISHQTRVRTLELMDYANKNGGFVIGTGDLSELALGWATYNGDHMSMYGVNTGVPKTLVRHIVQYVADTCGNDTLRDVLVDILDTPVSPELLPTAADGTIAQQTEKLVGPYELHDFYLYYVLRFGFSPTKIYHLARTAFDGRYEPEVLLAWLKNFYRRFFAQQFKRSCLPDGPKVGSVTLSPRGDWRMPSDACNTLWMAELEKLEV